MPRSNSPKTSQIWLYVSIFYFQRDALDTYMSDKISHYVYFPYLEIGYQWSPNLNNEVISEVLSASVKFSELVYKARPLKMRWETTGCTVQEKTNYAANLKSLND